MIEALQIPLAAGDGDAIEMLVILAFVVISIVSGLIQKANKTKKQREEQEAAGRRPQQTSPQPRMPPGRADTPPVRADMPPGRAEEVQALQPQADTRTVPQARSSRQSPARPPAAEKTLRHGLKPKKTSVESRRTGSAQVGSAHVGRLERAEEAEQAADSTVRIDLSAAEAARRAIILHEVFSSPKALRKSTELWEM